MLIWVFWGSLFLTLYTYLIYPVILAVLVKIRRIRHTDERDSHAETLSVAVLCAMYNEEKVVREKIDNFLQLKYKRIRLYIGSDGSSDATNLILREFKDNDKITFYEFPRRGKVHVINDLMAKATEEIVVFTDANSMFESNAVSNLVKYFQNLKVGAVCGRLILLSSGCTTGEGLYWRYETAIKKLENAMDCVIGANGAIYAVRRNLLKPLPINTINDDFINSMRVVEQGYGIRYAEDAVAYEEAKQNDEIEFRRHIRDGAGHYSAIVTLYKLLNPIKFKPFFLYVSHRVIRWLVPFFMIFMVVIPIFIRWDPIVHCIYAMEIIFYFQVIFAWLTKTKIRYLYFPYYFVYINVALFVGFLRTVLGLQKVAWDSTER